jgi:YHS domain-containing protein
MRFLIWLLLGYIGYRIIRALLSGQARQPGTSTTGTETYKDPVCGIYVAADDAVIGRIGDERIHFCSLACLEKYREQLN